jgi:hypothetical protein
MGKIRHSKLKNTGILFELLAGQMTADVLSNKDESESVQLVKEFFSGRHQLGKELTLYQTLLKEKFNSVDKAKDLISAVLESRKNLSNVKLRREKYNLIKKIKESYNVDDFFSSRIQNYRILASIYKLFEHSTSKTKLLPTEEVTARYTLIEHITSIAPKTEDSKSFIEDDKDLRLLTYKIMIDRFNERYNNSLNGPQKRLLKEYIYNISNTNSLREYVDTEVDTVKLEIESYIPKIKDKVIKIKLNEVANQIQTLKRGKLVKDDQIVSLMRYYELLKEIKKIGKK